MSNNGRGPTNTVRRSLSHVHIRCSGDNHTIVVLEDFCGDEIVWYTLLKCDNKLSYFCISKFCFFVCEPDLVKASP